MSIKRTACLAALVALSGLGGMLVLTADEDNQVTLRPQRTTRLYVRTVPPGATIKIDGESRGNSDRLFQIPPDVKKVLVEVELDGSGGRKDVIIRGGQITRVEFDLKRRPGSPDDTAKAEEGSPSPEVSIPDPLKNLPEGWTLQGLRIVSRQQTPAAEKDLGGRIEVWNAFLTAHGQRIQLHVMKYPTETVARTIHRAVLLTKEPPAFCLRFDETVVQFVGEFDADFAERAARALGCKPESVRRERADAFPPVVVETVPPSGDTKVDPALTEIRVTFSKHMMDQMWSWSQLSDESFPTTTGKPRYLADGRTCVLPVKLQPGKAYAIWLNSAKFGDFKDPRGRSAVPYLLIFETQP